MYGRLCDLHLTVRYSQAFSEALPWEPEDDDSPAAATKCKPTKYEKYDVVIEHSTGNGWQFLSRYKSSLLHDL